MEPSWGPLGASWAHFGSHFPPPGGPRGGHVWTFLGRPSRDLKNELLFVVFFTYLGSFFCAIICTLLSSLLRGWRHRAYAKKCKFIGFVGRKPYAPCSGNARSNQLSGGTRNKYRWKKELKKRTHGTRTHDRQMSIFEAKMAPKMDPGGFQKRAHKTVAN